MFKLSRSWREIHCGRKTRTASGHSTLQALDISCGQHQINTCGKSSMSSMFARKIIQPLKATGQDENKTVAQYQEYSEQATGALSLVSSTCVGPRGFCYNTVGLNLSRQSLSCDFCTNWCIQGGSIRYRSQLLSQRRRRSVYVRPA